MAFDTFSLKVLITWLISSGSPALECKWRMCDCCSSIWQIWQQTCLGRREIFYPWLSWHSPGITKSSERLVCSVGWKTLQALYMFFPPLSFFFFSCNKWERSLEVEKRDQEIFTFCSLFPQWFKSTLRWFHQAEFKPQMTLQCQWGWIKCQLCSSLEGVLFLFIVHRGANPVPWESLRGGEHLQRQTPHPKGSGPHGSSPSTTLALVPQRKVRFSVGSFLSFPLLGALSCDSWMWVLPRGGSAFLFVFFSSKHCVPSEGTGACHPSPRAPAFVHAICSPSPWFFMLWPFKTIFQNLHNCYSFLQGET